LTFVIVDIDKAILKTDLWVPNYRRQNMNENKRWFMTLVDVN